MDEIVREADAVRDGYLSLMATILRMDPARLRERITL